ncbi:MAG: VOC family protein [Candidatus Eremiobacteraeota bacterium]|nr:VOC family protein [Candidatus Eremiobacteraeota bacterium]
MLANKDAIATIAVRDLERGREFYGNALGLRELTEPENPDVIMYESGKSKIQVYRSQYAGTNKATVATWAVDDVDAIVQALRAKGVVFEHYDLPQLSLRGDVHAAENGFRVAWFKDPDGNVLSIVSAR